MSPLFRTMSPLFRNARPMANADEDERARRRCRRRTGQGFRL
jgi:hypothetical protein